FEPLLDLLAHTAADRDATLVQLRQRLLVFSLHRRLMSGYRPDGAVEATALLIGASRSPNVPAQQHWPDLFKGNVTVASLQSDHYSLLRAPLVAELAARIRTADKAG
ncbi:MAG: hypothetical protein ABI418_05740, partial [Jatrophihabitantaceae bacterium]